MATDNRKVLKVFWQHLLTYKGRVFLVFVSIALATGLETISPWYMKRIFDTLSGGLNSSMAWPIILKALLIILALRLGVWFFWRVCGFLTSNYQPHVMSDLQRTSLNYLLGHSYRFFSNNFAGALVRKVGRFSRGFETLSDEIQFRIWPLALVMIGATVGLYLRFPLMAWIFIAWVVIFIYLNYLSACWKMKIDIQRAAVDSESTGLLSDIMTNAITVKTFSGTAWEKALYQKVMDKWRRLQSLGWYRGETIFAIQGFMFIAIELGLFFFGLKLWVKNIITIGDLVLIQTYLEMVISRLWDIGRSFIKCFESLADAKEMVEIIEMPQEVKDLESKKEIMIEKGKIAFQKVGFNFHANRPILENFNLEIAPHEKIALVGPSGAGKTTITKLLFRFYDVKTGQILIDEQNIAQFDQESLREKIALVPQEPILFHRTLRENIRYGRRDATDEEIMEAARKAHCHEFIEKLPEGYETYVGERGVKLSGGERQRVAIARAILKNAPILVLDEATSSLDSQSEQLIQEALQELMRGRTTIVIAHRLSTIMMMDRIVVIEGGKISAIGTHQELLMQNGIYRELWEIQSGGFIQ